MNGPIQTRRSAAIGMAAVALLALAAGGCASTGINRGQVSIISFAEEVQLRQQMSVDVAAVVAREVAHVAARHSA